jgi:pyrimidine-specific ribonucleoside hydrolase
MLETYQRCCQDFDVLRFLHPLGLRLMDDSLVRFVRDGSCRAPAVAATVVLAALFMGCGLVPSFAPSRAPSLAATTTIEPVARTRLVIDTDMAPDDIVAIASLLRDPDVEVLAITVVGTGEAHCPGGMFVARSIVTMLLERPVPVACGRTSPMGDAASFPMEWRAGADAGNGLNLVSPAFVPDDRSSADVLVELAASEAAEGRRLTILTLGTLTNIATALAIDPNLSSKVRIVSMIGAVDVPGNVESEKDDGAKPVAEWNAHADPTALRIVLEARFDITLVGLDATNSVPLTPDLYHQLEADHTAGPADLVFELWARNQFMTDGGFYLWDPLAAAVVRDPTIVTTQPATLRVVEGAALDGGRLIEDASGSPALVATSADRDRFEAALLASLRIGGPRTDSFTPVGVLRIRVAPDVCEPTFEPDPLPEGLIRVEVDSTLHEPISTFVFGTAGIDWSLIEAFAAAPDYEHAPAVAVVASVSVAGPGSTTGWGDLRGGPLGVACAFGDPQAPRILLRGPFELSP